MRIVGYNREGRKMFYEHQASTIEAFEDSVHSVFWERRNGQSKVPESSGDQLDDLVASYKRLRKHFREVPDVHVALDITEEEAWLGVACNRYGLGLFYRIDADGSRHVWTSVNGEEPETFGYEALMRRIRSVFGEPHGITEHKSYVSDHIITRLLNGCRLSSSVPTPPTG